MAYIGNTVQNQGFAPAIDYFSGNGSTVTFTLSRNIASVAQIICAIDNVIQNPSSAYTVSGNAITFTSAPLSGTNNIWVEYTSLITTYAAISQSPSVIGDITASGGYLAVGSFGNSFIDGTIVDYVTGNGRITTGPADGLTIYNGGTSARNAMGTFDASGNFTNNATGYTAIATGTTAQRPGTPAAGMTRMNTTTGFAEYYTGAQWASYGTLSATSVSYLVVAGGGGGVNSGGGAGGMRTGTLSVSPGTSYTVTVGAGGAGAAGGNGSSGANSVFSSITSTGGGGGGGAGSNGVSGGSGGGGGASSTNTPTAGSGTSGQGNAGGTNGGIITGPYPSGGGGGAGAVGGNGVSTTQAGNGGAGSASSITGSSVTYAGGGGGAVYVAGNTPGSGGSGGGGSGSSSSTGGAGTTNTGGGGGGAPGNTGQTGGAGGSGIVVIAYTSTFNDATATGTYAKTTSGGNTIYTFTGSGTITF